MSKEEFLKIQKCVLKVNIHCDGCKHKVKKILQKIDGVFTTDIDSEQGKVTVSGNVDPAILIKRLAKSGKHGELWGAPKANNNQSNLPNQFKNMQIDNGKSGNNGGKGGQKGGGGGGGNNQPKSGQKPQQQQQQQQNQQQQQQNQQLQQQQLQQLQQMQQLQQLQQMKGFQDLKLPQLKGMQMPPNFKDQKAVKFNMREEEDLSDDEYDDLDDDDDYDYDNDELDDDMDEPHHPLTKGKPVMMGSGGQGMPPNMGMMKGNHPQMMNTAAQKGGGGNGGAQNGGGAVVNGKKGGGSGGGPVPVGGGNNEGKNGSGGKKGGGGGGDQHHNQGAGGGKNGGKSGGSPLDGKNGGGGNAKNGNGSQGGPNGSMNNGNGGKKGGGGGGGGGGMSEVQAMNNAFQNMGGRPQGMPGVSVGQMGNMNMGMGSMGSMPMSQMGNIPAVQGLPAGAMNGGGGGGAGGGYFQGAGPEAMPGNPYQQQQYLQAVMNQQRSMGNERFQPMMYARPPPAVNYMPPGPPQPYPYPYPYAPPPAGEPYTHFFSDENTSSCNVM